MTEPSIKGKMLDATQIKLIAIVTMLIDHIAWSFVPTYSLLGQTMHVVGRLTAPIMCFFIAQGYLHTHSLPKYFLRLGVFALISHIPYVYHNSGAVTLFPFSVIYTLFLGLLAVACYDQVRSPVLRWMVILCLCALSLPGDWSVFGVLFCLVFYIFRDDFPKQCLGILLIAAGELMLLVSVDWINGGSLLESLARNAFQFSIVLSLPVLSRYNGKRGGSRFSGWLFYVFYPLHLAVLGIIEYGLL